MINILTKKHFLFIFILLILSVQIIKAQLRNQWITIDSSGTGGMSYVDKDNIVTFYNKNGVYYIKTTNDGGNNWNTIYIDTISGVGYRSIIYPSINKIFVSGYIKVEISKNNYKYYGLLLKTIDTGKTWSKIVLDSNTVLESISMIDEQYGTALYKLGSDKVNDSLLITEDGWQSWKAKALSLETKRKIIQLQCLSKNDFILLLREYYYNGSPLNKAYIYITEDGGLNWKKSNSIPKNINKMKFIDKNIGWALGMSGGMDSLIYKTSDGGQTWIHQKYIEPGTIFFRYNDFDFFDKNYGLVIGQNGLILYTSDGGDTWYREFIPSNLKSHNVSHIIYPSLNTAYASLDNDYFIKRSIKSILKAPTIKTKCFANTVPVYGVKLVWDKIEGASHYELITSKSNRDSLIPYYTFSFDTIVTDTAFILDTLEYNTYYRFKIRAFNDSLSSEWNEDYIAGYLQTIHDKGAITLPIILEPEPYSGLLYHTSLMIKWTSLEKVNGYDLQLDNYKDPYTKINVYSESNYHDTTYLTDLLPASYYVFTIRSRRNDTTSEWATSMFFTEPLTNVFETPNNDNYSIIRDIYPNPTSGQCYIVLNNELASMLHLKIYNFIGDELYDLKILFQNQLSNNIFILNLSSLSSGVYLIVAQDKQNIYAKSFIIYK